MNPDDFVQMTSLVNTSSGTGPVSTSPEVEDDQVGHGQPLDKGRQSAMLGEQQCPDRLHAMYRVLSGTAPKETEQAEPEQNYTISSFSTAEEPSNESTAPFINSNYVLLVKLDPDHDASKKSAISHDLRRWRGRRA
jgi:hypothetical protein